MKKRVRHLLSVFIVSGFIIMAFGSEDDKKKETSGIEIHQVKKILDSGEDFKENFNGFMKNDLDSDLLIREIKTSSGKDNETFSATLNSHIGLIMQINKEDKSLRSVMMIGQGDGTTNSGLNIIMVMGGVIAAVDPALSPNERGKILKDIGILDKDFDVNNVEGSTIKNGVKYFINGSDQIGIMFGAETSND
ncbi:hypothetical protein NAT51_03080 [Flavobacterium amniphilum]|uniref:hypothetical protein n=1 Tax=Flavobacterium amniphilum TaxID=1834035 RepID=UPI00202A2274|nr:hypothetical protein [Flavobacterium amniphilum]MCL9804488.1 hypothetical protein [Flavobacterium amniphilum]